MDVNPTTLAQVIADYLDDRDDIASAQVIEGEQNTVGVETQGGGLLVVQVTEA